MTIDGALDDLRGIFLRQIVVRDIASPLFSFDASTPAMQAMHVMLDRQFDRSGVRVEGEVAAYARLGDLLRCDSDNTPLREYMLELPAESIVGDSESMLECVERFEHENWLFVRSMGHYSGIVTRADLQKPPVRMWLFGLITLVEMRLTQIVRTHFADHDIRDSLSAKRYDEAVKILKQRKSRKEEIDLASCLQFADKYCLTLRLDEGARVLGFSSNSKAKRTLTRMRKIRDELAHAQDLPTGDWDDVLEIVKAAERLIETAA